MIWLFVRKIFINLTSISKRHLNNNSRSFRILGVQQIAIGSLDKKILSDFWINKLGCTKISEYKSEVCQMVFILF